MPRSKQRKLIVGGSGASQVLERTITEQRIVKTAMCELERLLTLGLQRTVALTGRTTASGLTFGADFRPVSTIATSDSVGGFEHSAKRAAMREQTVWRQS